MRISRGPLAALAMVALIGAGCSNAPSESSTDGASATRLAQAVKFSECMREHGVSDFPDPEASGEMTIDAVVNGSSLDTSGPAWQEAMDACEDLQPPGFTGHRRNAEEQEAALRFAACMRENGVEDFPDPAADAPLVDTNRIPSSARPGGMDLLNAAMHRCGGVAAQAGAEGER